MITSTITLQEPQNNCDGFFVFNPITNKWQIESFYNFADVYDIVGKTSYLYADFEKNIENSYYNTQLGWGYADNILFRTLSYHQNSNAELWIKILIVGVI